MSWPSHMLTPDNNVAASCPGNCYAYYFQDFASCVPDGSPVPVTDTNAGNNDESPRRTPCKKYIYIYIYVAFGNGEELSCDSEQRLHKHIRTNCQE